MKILVDPEFSGLVKTLKQKVQAQILLAILSYPNDTYEHPVWQLMRKQIDRDAIKYKKRCETLSENRQNRWPNNNRNATDAEQTGGAAATETAQTGAISAGIEKSSIESEKQNEKEIDRKKDLDGIIKNERDALFGDEAINAALGIEKEDYWDDEE